MQLQSYLPDSFYESPWQYALLFLVLDKDLNFFCHRKYSVIMMATVTMLSRETTFFSTWFLVAMSERNQ
jgi:hypothetical protein